MKRLGKLLMTLCVVFSMVFACTVIAHAADGDGGDHSIKADKTEIVLHKFGQTRIDIVTGTAVESLDSKVTYEDGTEADYEIERSWGSWDGDKITLTATAGVVSGDYILKVYESADMSNCVDIHIKVFNQIDWVSLSQETYTYDGKVHKPVITVYDSAGNKVDPSLYTVQFDGGCKAVGLYSVQAKLKDDPDDCGYAWFEIVPKKTSLVSITGGDNSMTVKWSKGTGVNGYLIEYSKYKDFRTFESKTVKGISATSAKIRSAGYGTKYYVRVKTYKLVDDYYYYSNPSGVKSVTVPALTREGAKTKMTKKLNTAIKKSVADPAKVKVVKAWVGKSDSTVFSDKSRMNVIVFKYKYGSSTRYALGWLYKDNGGFAYDTRWTGNEYYLTNRYAYSISKYM